MRTIQIILFSFTFLFCSKSFAVEVSLDEAIKKKQIQVITRGTGGYMGKCLELNVTNRTSYKLDIKLEAGSIFHSFDEGLQDLMVTSDLLFVLRPKAKEVILATTMCIQSHNASPSKGAYFRFGRQAEGDLFKLASLISEYNYQASTAQSAVWAITDGASISDIYGSDTTMVRRIATVVSDATGVAMSSFNFTPRQHSISSINTSIECLIPDYVTDATLTAYDKNGNRFRQYKIQKEYKPGFYQIKLGLNHTMGDDEEFDLKFEAGGKLIAEKHININDSVKELMKMDKETDVTYEVPKDTKARIGIYDEDDNLYILLADDYLIKKGFNKSVFEKGRDLPKGKNYFFKVKEGKKTIVSQKIHLDKLSGKKYAPITRRGVYRCVLKETVDKAKLAVYDEEGNVVWVVFENSYVNKGNKTFNYVFQHRKGPDATFYLRVTNKEGKVLAEQKIKGKR